MTRLIGLLSATGVGCAAGGGGALETPKDGEPADNPVVTLELFLDDGTVATGHAQLLEYQAPGGGVEDTAAAPGIVDCAASTVIHVGNAGGVNVSNPTFADLTPGTKSLSDGFPVARWHPTDDSAQFYQMTDELIGGSIEISVWTDDRIELILTGGLHCLVYAATTGPCVPANGVVTMVGLRGAPIPGQNTPGMWVDAASEQLLCDAENPP